MADALTRRDFLKLSTLAFSSVAVSPWERTLRSLLPEEDQEEPVGIARVATQAIRIYQEPSYQSERIGWRRRDELLDIITEVISPHGPARNPLWYRVVGGYAHSTYLQRVEGAYLNQPLDGIREGGQLGEITVPFSQSYRYTKNFGWSRLYRLYYGSVYWITHLDEGPDGSPWYGLTDDRLRIVYHVPAAHVRPVADAELAPISPNVPPEEKVIKVSLAEQKLVAVEGDREVFQALLSSGLPSSGPSPNGIPTDTPKGKHYISLKTPSRHMGDGEMTSDLEAYELPGVPWVCFFHVTGVGFHGTYWHDNFGSRMSHGCVNLRNEDALWLYRWTAPVTGAEDWFKKGRGTLVQVF